MLFRWSILVLILGAFVVGLVGGRLIGSEGGNVLPALADNQTPMPTIATSVERITPTATPVPLPDRTSCDEIRGSEYRSPAERDWFLANCKPVVPPAPVLPAIPGAEVQGERWIFVDIGKQQMSAVIGDKVIHTALVTTGKAGWETPPGTYRILYRVANETMTSASIGAEEEYVLKDVLYTQYFTTEGHAIHLNYWRDESYFGSTPSSHGCVGVRLADAEWFWRFAGSGTRVTIV